MFGYHLRISWRRLKANPVISALIVIGIAVGIAIAMTSLAIYRNSAYNPISHKNDQLYYVRLNSWSPERPFQPPNEPPDQLTYRDAMAMVQSPIPTRAFASYKSFDFIHGPDPEKKPVTNTYRLTHNDFFPMFEVPFLYGGPWNDQADNQGEFVTVISKSLNDKFFDGENSVSKTIKIGDQLFTITGVMDTWDPKPNFYDPTQSDWSKSENVFVPFNLINTMQPVIAGNSSNWGKSGDTFEEQLQSEMHFLQCWVELPMASQRADFAQFMDNYALEQRKSGRFQRALNNKIQTPEEWLEYQQVVDDSAKTYLLISFLVLLVCILNVIGLILAKFLAKSGEIAVRRALGAKRNAIFNQHLVESGLIGSIGCALAMPVTILLLKFSHHIFGGSDAVYRFDWQMGLILVMVSLLASVFAGLLPAWRVCQIPLSSQLKSQ